MAKNISTYDFNTLYSIIPQVLSEIIHFFKSKVRSKIGVSSASIYRTSKGLGKRYFKEKILSRQLRSSSKIVILPLEI